MRGVSAVRVRVCHLLNWMTTYLHQLIGQRGNSHVHMTAVRFRLCIHWRISNDPAAGTTHALRRLTCTHQLNRWSSFLKNVAVWLYVPPMVVSNGYCFFFLKGLAWPPVVRIGVFHTPENRAMGASTYGHTGPKNTSIKRAIPDNAWYFFL